MPNADTTATIKRRVWIVFYYLAFSVVYLLIGGLCMQQLEEGREKESLRELVETVNRIGLSTSQRKTLEEIGVCSFPDFHSAHWTFTGATFYSLTVVTTIGYGSFAPVTKGGRAFTVVYAIVGISVIGMLLGNVATVLAGLLRSIGQRVFRCFRRRSPAAELERVQAQAMDKLAQGDGCLTSREMRELLVSYAEGRWDENVDETVFGYLTETYADNGVFDREAVVSATAEWFQVHADLPREVGLPTIAAFFLASSVWIGVWAVVFRAIEGWSYSESLWFACVTLSTIGFGDFTPETKSGRITAFLFIAPGIGIVAGFISAMSAAFQTKQFWMLQNAHRRGKVSAKLLVAQGINVNLLSPTKRRKRPESPLLEQPFGDSIPLSPVLASHRHTTQSQADSWEESLLARQTSYQSTRTSHPATFADRTRSPETTFLLDTSVRSIRGFTIPASPTVPSYHSSPPPPPPIGQRRCDTRSTETSRLPSHDSQRPLSPVTKTKSFKKVGVGDVQRTSAQARSSPTPAATDHTPRKTRASKEAMFSKAIVALADELPDLYEHDDLPVQRTRSNRSESKRSRRPRPPQRCESPTASVDIL